MKLSEIVSSVRGRLDDQSFSSTTITEAANWLQNDIFSTTRTRLMEASTTINASSGAVVSDLPDDFNTIISIAQTSPKAFDIMSMFVNHADFVKMFPDYATRAASVIQYWTDFSNQIRFSAPLSTNVTLTMDYIRQPVPMVRDTDVCEIPDQYKEIITRGTLLRVMEQNEDYAEASGERQIVNALITNFIASEGRGQVKTGPVIMKSNRRRYSLTGRGVGETW